MTDINKDHYNNNNNNNDDDSKQDTLICEWSPDDNGLVEDWDWSLCNKDAEGDWNSDCEYVSFSCKHCTVKGHDQ